MITVLKKQLAIVLATLAVSFSAVATFGQIIDPEAHLAFFVDFTANGFESASIQMSLSVSLNRIFLQSSTVWSLADFSQPQHMLLVKTGIGKYSLVSETSWGGAKILREKLSVGRRFDDFTLQLDAHMNMSWQDFVWLNNESLTISAIYERDMILSGFLTFEERSLLPNRWGLQANSDGLTFDYSVEKKLAQPATESLTFSAELPGLRLTHSIVRDLQGGTSERFEVTPEPVLTEGITSGSRSIHQASDPQKSITRLGAMPPSRVIHPRSNGKGFIDLSSPPIFLDLGNVPVGDVKESETISFPTCPEAAVYCWFEIDKAPGLPFSMTGTPSETVVMPGEIAAVTFRFYPRRGGPFTDEALIKFCRAVPPLSQIGSERRPLQVPDPATSCSGKVIILEGVGLEYPVVVCFGSPGHGTPSTNFEFNGSNSRDPDGNIIRYRWDFRDGSAAEGVTARHRFSGVGSHTVSLTVWDNDNLQKSTSCAVTVDFDIGLGPVVLGALAAGYTAYTLADLPPKGFAPAIDSEDIAVGRGFFFFPVNQLLIKFKERIGRNRARQLISQVAPGSSPVVIGYFPPINAYLFKFEKIDKLLKVADKVNTLEDIQTKIATALFKLWVIKNYLGEAEGAPCDPDLCKLIITQPESMKAYTSIRVPEAWNAAKKTTRTPRKLVLALIDSGIDGQHAEFQGLLNNDSGKSYIQGDTDWRRDSEGHGTEVGGIIAAENGHGDMNGILAGATRNYQLLVYRTSMSFAEVSRDHIQALRDYLGKIGTDLQRRFEGLQFDASRPTLSSVLDAIREAHNKGAKIINLSLGWGAQNAPSDVVEKIYDIFDTYMDQYSDLLFVSSAGNGDHSEGGSRGFSLEKGKKLHAPGGVDADNNITVAATDENGERLTQFSNYGPSVDIAAPGVNVFTTNASRDKQYITRIEGTSFSAALVSGTAAMMLAFSPGLSPVDVKRVLRNNAHSLGRSDGIGLIDCGKVMEAILKE